MDDPPIGRRLWAPLAALAAAVAVSQSFGRFTYSLLFTDIRDDFGLSNTIAGALGSLNLLAYLLGSVLVSATVARVGMGRTVKAGLFGVVVTLALLAWSPSIGLVTATMVLAGATAAGVWVTAPGIATEVLGASKRGVAAGWITGGVGLGLVAASVIDAAISQRGWRLVYLVEFAIGIVVVVALVVTTRHLGKRSPLASSATTPASLASSATTPASLASSATTPASPDDSAITPASASSQSRLRVAAKALKQVPAWRLTMWIYSMFGAVISLVLTFTVALLTEDAGLSSTTAAVAFSLIGVGSMFGGPLLGALVDKLGSRRSIAIGLLLAITGIVATASGNPVAALIGAFVFGVSFTGHIAAIVAHIAGHLDGDSFGAAYGLVTIVFGAGLALGPQVGGLAADLFDSFLPAFVLAIALCVISLALTGWGDDPQPRSHAASSR